MYTILFSNQRENVFKQESLMYAHTHHVVWKRGILKHTRLELNNKKKSFHWIVTRTYTQTMWFERERHPRTTGLEQKKSFQSGIMQVWREAVLTGLGVFGFCLARTLDKGWKYWRGGGRDERERAVFGLPLLRLPVQDLRKVADVK